jgi:hypothetical protein
MTATTRWVLAHKRLVTAFWVLVTVVGMATVGSATSAFSNKFTAAGGARALGRLTSLSGRDVRDERDEGYSGVVYAPLIPPSTRNVEAVTKLDSSPARNRTALAISSARAKRPIGTWTRRLAACSRSLA